MGIWSIDQPQTDQAAGVVSGTDDHRGARCKSVLFNQIVGNRSSDRIPGHQPGKPVSQTRRGGPHGRPAPPAGPNVCQIHAETVTSINGRQTTDEQGCQKSTDECDVRCILIIIWILFPEFTNLRSGKTLGCR